MKNTLLWVSECPRNRTHGHKTMKQLRETGKRNANMELLRIVTMLMVTVLHALGKGGLLQPVTAELPFGGWVTWFLECLSVCAVNVFMLLSGYYIVHAKWKLGRFFGIVFQTVFYSAIPYFLWLALGKVPVEERGIYNYLQAVLPVHMEVYWFITAYALLYLMAPVITAGINALEEKQLRIVILCLLTYECIFKTVLPVMLTTDTRGYKFDWYLIMFLIGAYFQKYGFRYLKTAGRGWIFYILSCVLSYAETIAMYIVKAKTGRLGDFSMHTLDYNQLFVVCASVGLFTAFLHAKPMKESIGKIICAISPMALGVYLLQETLVLRFTWQGWFGLRAELLNASLAEILLRVFCAVICMFALGIAVDACRRFLFHLAAMPFGKKKGTAGKEF